MIIKNFLSRNLERFIYLINHIYHSGKGTTFKPPGQKNELLIQTKSLEFPSPLSTIIKGGINYE